MVQLKILNQFNKCHTAADVTNMNQDEMMEVLRSKISASNQIKDLLETFYSL